MIEMQWRDYLLYYRYRVPDIMQADYTDWPWSEWILVEEVHNDDR